MVVGAWSNYFLFSLVFIKKLIKLVLILGLLNQN
jgi:hypothetical protein